MTDLIMPSPPSPADAPARPGGAAAGAPASALADSAAADLAVVVAPSTGRFHPRPVSDATVRAGELSGATVRAGELLGHVTGGGGRADEVRCPVDATIQDLLVRPGQLVSRGQGLAWLRRREAA